MRNQELDSRGDSPQHHRGRSGFHKGPLFFVGLVVLIWTLVELKALLIALVFSITLASAIAPIAEKAEIKWKISRTITVIVIFGIVGVIYSFLVAALFPTLREQALSLYDNLPKYTEGLNILYNRLRELFGESVTSINVSPTEIKSVVSKVSSHALHLGTDLATVIATTILVLFLTAFFVVEANTMWPKLLEWLPKAKRERAAKLIRPLESRLGGYIRGQLLVCVAVSTFLTIGLSLLKVEHALLLGALSGLLNLVPFVGSMITAVLSLLVAFNQSPELAGAVLLLFALEQYCESNLIVPNLLGKQVELHPLVVLFAILIGASLLGVSGALIAVPVATAGTLLAQEFYLKPLKEKESRLAAEEIASQQAAFDDDSFANAAAILSETRPTAKSTIETPPEKEVVVETKDAAPDNNV
jgi:predicted PurR-regulated permease PerM